MTFIKKNLVSVVALVLAIIALGNVLLSKQVSQLPSFGAATPTGETNYNVLGVDGLKVGTNCDTSFSSSAANGCKSTTHLIVNTCNLLGMDVSNPATTTRPYDCAITGVTSSDAVIAQLATSTPGFIGVPGWVIMGAKASTTAGYVTVDVANLSGAAAVPSITGVGSSTQVIIFQ